jgi:hypothetical protein
MADLLSVAFGDESCCRSPPRRHLPSQNAQEAWMVYQVIKDDPDGGGKSGNGLLCHQRRKDLVLEFMQFLVSSSQHRRIQAQLIPKVAKEQIFIEARALGNRIDACAIEAVVGKLRFGSGKDRLSRLLPSFPFCF